MGIAELPPLPLADRIEEQRGDAVRGEEGGGPLVGVVGFADVGMAAGHEHARPRPWKRSFVGQEKRGGHEDARLAREDDLLHRVARLLDAAGHLWVERRSFRKWTDRREEGITEPLLPRGDVSRRGEAFPLAAVNGRRGIDLLEEEAAYHVGTALCLRRAGAHGQQKRCQDSFQRCLHTTRVPIGTPALRLAKTHRL